MFLAAPEKDFVIKSSIPATSFMQKRISLYLHKKDAEQKGHKKQTFPIRSYAAPIVHTTLTHNQNIFLVLMVLQN